PAMSSTILRPMARTPAAWLPCPALPTSALPISRRPMATRRQGRRRRLGPIFSEAPTRREDRTRKLRVRANSNRQFAASRSELEYSGFHLPLHSLRRSAVPVAQRAAHADGD